jgi:ribose transport system ATP-binding protein
VTGVTEGSPTPAAAAGTALRLAGVGKRFGGTVALDGAHLAVRRGTVHALLGGNGSGKSTAVKVLAGVHQADAGELSVMGVAHDLHGWTGQVARDAGLRFVHQDLGLFDDLSIEENFALGAGYPARWRGAGIRWSRRRDRVRRALADAELDHDPRTPVNRLRPVDRTLVAIARARADRAGELVLVLDEPTATLPLHESALLLSRIRARAGLGQTVLLVSHRLHEVLAVADDYTVLRDGRTAGVLTDASPTEADLVELMAGRAVASLQGLPRDHPRPDAFLRLTGLTGGPLRGVDLDVGRGEIVGVAGLVGSGRSSLLRAVFGELRPTGGRMALAGAEYEPRGARAAMAAGVALVPEDRHADAAFPDLPVTDNLSVTVLGRYRRPWGISRPAERSAARSLIDRFGVAAAGPDAVLSSLSGGNQQKVVLARWLQRRPGLLLLDEPTQGVDLMSRVDLYELVRGAAADGTAVLVASSDVAELAALCDRVVVLAGGRVVETLAGNALDPDVIAGSVLRSGARGQEEPR